MASIKKIASMYFEEFYDGVQWIALWKAGKDWNAEVFFSVDYNEEAGIVCVEDAEELERMEEILKLDQDAVMLNGYYCNLGNVDDMTADSLSAALRWQYEECESSYLYTFVHDVKMNEGVGLAPEHMTAEHVVNAIRQCPFLPVNFNESNCVGCPNLKHGSLNGNGYGECRCNVTLEAARNLELLMAKNKHLSRRLSGHNISKRRKSP